MMKREISIANARAELSAIAMQGEMKRKMLDEMLS